MPLSNKQLIENNKGEKTDVKLNYVRQESIFRLFLYTLDTLLISLAFLYFSLGGSSFIYSFICQKLDKSKSEISLFFETTFESLTIIFLIYILVFYIPKLPSIVPYPDINHIKFRQLCRHAVVGASIIFAHERLFEKYQYFLGVDQK